MEVLSTEFRIQLVAIITSFVLMFLVVRLILRGKLREEYSIIWISGTALMLLFSIWRNGIDVLGSFFGVYSAPNLFFFAAVLLILIYLLHISVVLSKLQKQNKSLSQEIALLKDKYEDKAEK